MSELSIDQRSRNAIRWNLLSSVSLVALSVHVISFVPAEAADTEQPSVWIELGGQFEQADTTQEVYSPAFFTPQPSFTGFTPGMTQKPLDFSFGANGAITIQPEGSDWVFSAGVRYGRSNGNKHIHQSTPGGLGRVYINSAFVGSIGQRQPKFFDATANRTQNYEVLDFQAGKDVGLGLFGKDSRAVLSLGVRFAQFHSTLRGTLGLDPNNGGYKYFTNSGNSVKAPNFNAHDFLAGFSSLRSFHGLGPVLSWSDSVPIAGHADSTMFTADWGANAAILFGRQKTTVHHQSTAYSHPGGSNQPYLVYKHTPPDIARSRSATVPNLGGFAGVSLKFPNAKISLGYRADFFFGAMDGGIGTAHKENIGFYGPFASVSIGLGG